MSYTYGKVARPQTGLTITLDGLAVNTAQIATQYTYGGGESKSAGVYPAAGWLQLTLTPAGATAAGEVVVALLPGFGDAGDVAAAYSKTNANVAEANLEMLEVLTVATIDESLFGAAATVVKQIWLGDRNLLVGGAGLEQEDRVATPFEYLRTDHAECELPRYWSLIVYNNMDAAISASGNTAIFQPVFDYAVL